MKIEHLAIWAKDIEALKSFYEQYFDGKAGERYFNPTKNFQSYFLSFEGGCRLELMQKPKIPGNKNAGEATGLTHFAVSVGSEAAVDALTENLRSNGHRIVGEPRWTGDGYYESVVLDPEGNRVEITA
ncbi:MAG: VOC family protein [Saprospiraceae bacterium]|nr:VOC family protein [Saprospiraceae bacterium]